jgi:hypothetical protein
VIQTWLDIGDYLYYKVGFGVTAIVEVPPVCHTIKVSTTSILREVPRIMISATFNVGRTSVMASFQPNTLLPTIAIFHSASQFAYSVYHLYSFDVL